MMPMKESVRYTASLDNFSKTISTLVALLATGMLISPLLIPQSGDLTAMVVAGLFLALLSLVFFLRQPVAYTVSSGGITVEKRWGSLEIPAHTILQIKPLPREYTEAVIRTFGNGGLFGYTGRYHYQKTGSMLWQCTRRSGCIEIIRAGKLPLVISPDQADRFLDASRRFTR
jgi:hypothetical protein